MSVKDSEVFRDSEAAQRWLRNALIGWFTDQIPDAYAPFFECFSFRSDPSEILHNIYRDLPSARASNYQNGPKGAMRDGAAALLGDAELLRDYPAAFGELLNFGGTIGSLEILASITRIIGQPQMKSREREASLAAQAFQIVQRTYPEPGNAFLIEAERNVGDFGIGVADILLAWARHDPAKWSGHVLRLQSHLYDYYVLRLGDPAGERALHFVVNDFVKALGEAHYRQQIKILSEVPAWDQLDWLLTYAAGSLDVFIVFEATPLRAASRGQMKRPTPSDYAPSLPKLLVVNA